MVKQLHLLLILFGSLATLSIPLLQAQNAATENSILGKWINEDQTTVVEFYKEGNTVSGRIVWLKNNNQAIDEKNNNPKLQNRPLRGINLVASALYNGTNQTWEKGVIYDYQNGLNYNCQMWLTNATTPAELHIKTYGYLSLFGTTTVWYRPPQNHPIYKGSH